LKVCTVPYHKHVLYVYGQIRLEVNDKKIKYTINYVRLYFNFKLGKHTISIQIKNIKRAYEYQVVYWDSKKL
jgi:hypothetical protein